MKETKIKDNFGRIIGSIEDHGTFKKVKDSLGRVQGSYDKSSDRTKDAMGRIKSEGDTLTNFLY